MFTLVGNNSFVQISGIPIHDLYVGPNGAEGKTHKRKRETVEPRRRVKRRKTIPNDQIHAARTKYNDEARCGV